MYNFLAGRRGGGSEGVEIEIERQTSLSFSILFCFFVFSHTSKLAKQAGNTMNFYFSLPFLFFLEREGKRKEMK